MADNGAPATWFAFTADAPWKSPKCDSTLQGPKNRSQKIKGQRSMISLMPEEHRALHKQRSQQMQRSKSQIFLRSGEAQEVRSGSIQQVHRRTSKASSALIRISEVREVGAQQINGRPSKTALRSSDVSDVPKSGFQHFTRQTSRSSVGCHALREEQSNTSRQVREQKSRKSLRSEATERSKFFVCVQEFPSWFILAKGAVLTNAVFFHETGKLYEFVYPPCYKPVFLWPSLWQKRHQAPEYHVQLLDAKRYVPEPIVVLREAHQDAPAGRSWRVATEDEQAVHIASCYHETVIRIVKRELKRKLEYCSNKYEKALEIKGGDYRTFREIHLRNHRLMELAADCAGEKGARGANWLFNRLESYFEFVGKKEGDEVVLRAAKSVVDDIQSTAKLMDIGLG